MTSPVTTGSSIKCEPHGLYMCSHCAIKVSDSDLVLLRITFANLAKYTGSPSEAMVESALLELIEARRALTASEKDAARYRWITEDHDDRDVRRARSAILERMSVMSYSAASYAIDAAMEKANG